MRCQSCGYISFDYLSACKKCGGNTSAARDALGLVAGKPTMPFLLGALISVPETAPAATAAPEGVSDQVDSLFAEIDFGNDDVSFDLTEEKDAITEPASTAGATPSSPAGGGDWEEIDAIELEIGSALDEELVLDMSALDESPSDLTLKEEDFLLGSLESKPVASAVPPAPGMQGSPAPGDDGDLQLDLGSDFEIELNMDELSPPGSPPLDIDPPKGFASPGEDLVIDLGDDDLQGLLLELEDTKKGSKATA